MKIYTKIFIGLVAGAVVGLILTFTGLGDWGGYLQPFGDAFINLIKMVVIPLVMASLTLGVASLGDVRALGRIGLKTMAFYAVAISLAVTFGLFVANIFQPGAGLDEEKRDQIVAEVSADESYAKNIADAQAESKRERNVGDILLNLIPTNPIKAMADGNMLPIIVFSIMFGLALTLIAEEPRNKVLGILEGINEAMIVLVNIIMALAPYGVFAIIAAVTAQLGFDFLLSLLRYALVTIGAMAVYLTVFYGAGVRLLGGLNPIRFFKEMRPVMLLAFSTCSSNATLPENMNVTRERLGVPKEVVSFSLPLGATINMDGTAIYQGVSAMFIAQVFGMPLSLEQQLMVVLTASLASIGAAGVPGIGMVTLAMVLSSVNLPPMGIALVLGVERVLDMCRTTLNVVGDATGAVIVGNSEGGLKPAAENEKEAA